MEGWGSAIELHPRGDKRLAADADGAASGETVLARVGAELHEELTYLVDSVTDLCTSIEQEFFHSTELQTQILAEQSIAAAQQ